jgi:hypothetical protein
VANVSFEHEAPVAVLRESPGTLLQLLKIAGHAVECAGVPSVVDSDVTEPAPLARRADLVALVRGRDGEIAHVVVVEVQRSRDEEKLSAWPVYIAQLAARHGAPVTLLVITFDAAVARWAATPQAIGPNMTVTPTVIGPELLPRIESAEHALAHPHLAVLVVLARLEERPWSALDPVARREILIVCHAFAASRDKRLRELYLSLIEAAADDTFRDILRTLRETHNMELKELIFNAGKTEGEAAGMARGRAQGKAEGKAELLLRLLARRGFRVDATTEQRVMAASAPELDAWFDRAVDAARLEDVIAP